MNDNNFVNPALLIFTLFLFLPTVSSCSSMYFYDSTRDQQARSSINLLDKLHLDASINQWQKNLDEYLNVELNLVDQTTDFLLRNSVWRLATGNLSLAELYLNSERRILQLGFSSVNQVPAYLKMGVTIKEQEKRLEEYRRNIGVLNLQLEALLPSCDRDIPEYWEDITGLHDESVRQKSKILYGVYYGLCKELLDSKGHYDKLGGDIAAAREKLSDLQNSMEKVHSILARDQNRLFEAKKALAEAVDDRNRNLEHIEKSTTQLEAVLDGLESKQQILPDEIINGISSMLQSVKGDAKANIRRLNGDDYVAAVVAKSTLPLGGSLESFIDGSAPLDFPALVFELNRQLLIRDYNGSQKELLDSKLSVAKEAENLLFEQAGADYRLVVELCLFSYGRERKVDCESSFKLRRNKKSGAIECGFNQYQDQCPLNVSFRAAWDQVTGKNVHLLNVITALSDSNFYQGEYTKTEFKQSDLLYRDDYIATKSAIFQWSNLFKVPTQDIASYYEAGIKKGDLSDFIVKAFTILGLTVAVKN